MDHQSSNNGVYDGWYFRFVGLVVVAVAALQIVAKIAFRTYTVETSMPLAVVIVAYIIAPRVKTRRLANTVLGVLGIFVIDVLLQVFWEHALNNVPAFLELNVLALIMGLILAFLYLKLTEWSEKKRLEWEAKRREKLGVTPKKPPVRRHTVGKKKRKKRR